MKQHTSFIFPEELIFISLAKKYISQGGSFDDTSIDLFSISAIISLEFTSNFSPNMIECAFLKKINFSRSPYHTDGVATKRKQKKQLFVWIFYVCCKFFFVKLFFKGKKCTAGNKEHCVHSSPFLFFFCVWE